MNNLKKKYQTSSSFHQILIKFIDLLNNLEKVPCVQYMKHIIVKEAMKL